MYVNMNDEDLVDLFVDNLKWYLRDPVRLYLLDKPKDDLELAFKAAILIGYEKSKEHRRSQGSRHEGSDGKHASAKSARTDRKQCYNCGSYDHLLAACPKPRTRGRHGAGGQNKSGWSSQQKTSVKTAKAAPEAKESSNS